MTRKVFPPIFQIYGRWVSTCARQAVTIEKRMDSKVWHIGLNSPHKRNAVDGATAKALFDAFLEFESSQSAQVAILFGEGGHFSAGADLKSMNDAEKRNPLISPTGDRMLGPMGPTRLDLRKPVIAAVQGSCVAGGLELALWCHLRIVERTARLGVLCRRFGVPLIDGGTFRLPRLIGESRAMDLILTGREIDGEEAHRIGLATRLCEEGECLAEAEKIAAALASFPQKCLRADMTSARDQWGLSEREAIQREFAGGIKVVEQEALQGASEFAKGAGRHGHFQS